MSPALDWSLLYHLQAMTEGWSVFAHDAGQIEYQIQRIDAPEDAEPVFENDADAWKHVVEKARDGSPIHVKALEVISPDERDRIKKECGEWRISSV